MVELAVAAENNKLPLLLIESPQSSELRIESADAVQRLPWGNSETLDNCEQ